jgi:hypothetical protein
LQRAISSEIRITILAVYSGIQLDELLLENRFRDNEKYGSRPLLEKL